MADNYRNEIKAAGWTYLESKFCRYLIKPRNKMRWIGRMLKKVARREDRKEIARDRDE